MNFNSLVRTLLESHSPDWAPPNIEDEQYEIFKKAIQLLSQDEFRSLIDKKMEGKMTEKSRRLLKKLKEDDNVPEYYKKQTDVANCLAGISFIEAAKDGNIRNTQNWHDILDSSTDYPFRDIKKELKEETDEAKKIKIVKKWCKKFETDRHSPKDVDFLIRGIIQNVVLPAPIIYHDSKNGFVTGKNRIICSLAFELNPNIWVFGENEFKKAIKKNIKDFTSEKGKGKK